MSAERKPHIPPPTDSTRPYTELSLPQYRVFLRYLNQQYVDQARGLLESAPLGSAQCLVLTGSDGKCERHAQSKTEFIIVQAESSDNLSPDALMEWFNETHTEEFGEIFDLALDPKPEVKVVGDSTSFVSDAYGTVFTQGNRRVFPDRILNSTLLMGNEDVYKAGRRQVLEEMTNNAKRSKSIREDMLKQLKSHRKTLKTGMYKDRQTFTTNPAVQYYDEDVTRYTTGFKIGLLRTMQRFLDIATVVAIRGGYLTVARGANELPSETPDRIRFLQELGMFSDAMAAENAIDAYIWFLQQYHFAQEQYKRGRTAVALPFDPDIFEGYRRILDSFTEKGYYSPSKNFLAQVEGRISNAPDLP